MVKKLTKKSIEIFSKHTVVYTPINFIYFTIFENITIYLLELIEFKLGWITIIFIWFKQTVLFNY